MAIINQGDNTFPILEQSSKERMVSYGIYKNESQLYPQYKHVLLKFISFRPSPVVQRDEGFAMLTNDIEDMCERIISQGFVMFSRHPEDPASLVFSFM